MRRVVIEPLTLRELVASAQTATGSMSWDLSGVAGSGPSIVSVDHDTSTVRAGSVFCCIVGQRVDGHELAAEAVARGAVGVVAQRRVDVDVPVVVVPDTRLAVAHLSAAAHGWPSRDLHLIGITGTNGKTSTSGLLAGILDTCGHPTAVRGTLDGGHTTPEAPVLHHWLAQARALGRTHAVMEVSSHALVLERVAGIEFEVGVFTNLGRDHLDFHGTTERYFAAKARLFEPGRCRLGVVNRDDVHGRLLLDATSGPMVAFGRDDIHDVEVTAFDHRYRWRGHQIRVPLGGDFHVMNSLAAATTAVELGLDSAAVADALSHATPLPGRFEVLEIPGRPRVVIDYAHTPDGLAEVLTSARHLATARDGRVVVVFGCGGERDRDKRPEMGEIAVCGADEVVVTSDNPRCEDPTAIIAEIVAGVPDEFANRLVATIPDRAQAIAAALERATPNDLVIIAGKGHETGQDIAGSLVDFDDRRVAVEILTGVRS